MANNIVEFKTKHDQTVEEVLKEAIDKRFDTVYVLGINATGVHLTHSGTQDILHELGAIEAMKDNLLENW